MNTRKAIHRRHAVWDDYNIEMQFSHRSVAFHDIRNPDYPDLGKLWKRKIRKDTSIIYKS